MNDRTKESHETPPEDFNERDSLLKNNNICPFYRGQLDSKNNAHT